ncbi:hypothetical protein N7495_006240 [Penicillium taxi]|uniref:uncharacterized protein n=1 Tax=Penicillium taxi TaxID=168475 RepID=UPI0025454809|nr:uncharacterized protein N7495_006240 [Penicillium taxi]KAJ5894549.1 hypothetical protein N7495_006240 [Penicillium taxi]
MGRHDVVLSEDTSTIDLSTAENWAAKMLLLQSINGAYSELSEHNLAYPSSIGGCPTTRERIADLLNRHFKPSITVKSSHIVLTAGASFALTALVEQICNPGDGILIAAPYWAGLDISISTHCHATIVPVHVPLNDFFSKSSIQSYQEEINNSKIPIKAILVCNPHNPLGQCYPRETLRALLELCERHKLHYISDEVYALSAHQPFAVDFQPFVSALQLGKDGLKDQIHVVYSLSKDFGCNGIRVGALITQFNDAVRLSTALSVYNQVSTLSTVLASKLILKPATVEKIAKHGGEQLIEAYKSVKSFLEKEKTQYVPVTHGMFVFARLGRVNDFDEEERLLKCFKCRGLSVSSGSGYHFQEAGWFRICYGVPDEQLQEGLRRIGLGIQDFQAGK